MSRPAVRPLPRPEPEGGPTPPPLHLEPDPGPADRFAGFFGEEPWPQPPPGGLLDHPPARAWLALIDQTCRRGLYTFQAPLEGKAGRRVSVDGRPFLLLSSYDYLGLLGDPRIEEAAVRAVRAHGSGTGGVRLLTGTTALHRELEDALAAFTGTEEAIVFTSGYLANLGAITALFGPRDRVVADERVHRSIIDACRLAHVPLRRFRHNDPEALDEELGRGGGGRRTLVVVEGVYSMDGDVCPLPDLVEVKDRHGAWLMVDEAHSFGALGEGGRGIAEHHGVPPGAVDLWMGSLSKAIPAVGGFLAGSRELMIYLQHGASSFMFSAALAPAAAGAALEALRVLRSEPWRVERLQQSGKRLRDGLRALGYPTGDSGSAIVPVLCGERERAFRLARALYDEGVLASAVIPPAVPDGGSRLRLCATAALADADLAEAFRAFEAVRGRWEAGEGDGAGPG